MSGVPLGLGRRQRRARLDERRESSRPGVGRARSEHCHRHPRGRRRGAANGYPPVRSPGASTIPRHAYGEHVCPAVPGAPSSSAPRGRCSSRRGTTPPRWTRSRTGGREQARALPALPEQAGPLPRAPRAAHRRAGSGAREALARPRQQARVGDDGALLRLRRLRRASRSGWSSSPTSPPTTRCASCSTGCSATAPRPSPRVIAEDTGRRTPRPCSSRSAFVGIAHVTARLLAEAGGDPAGDGRRITAPCPPGHRRFPARRAHRDTGSRATGQAGRGSSESIGSPAG